MIELVYFSHHLHSIDSMYSFYIYNIFYLVLYLEQRTVLLEIFVFTNSEVIFTLRCFYGPSSLKRILFSMSLLKNFRTFCSKIDTIIVYEAFFAKALRRLKWLSASSCVITCIATPYLVLQSQNDISTIGKIMLAGTLISFGVGSTVLLQYASRPYVSKIRWSPSQKQQVQLETYDWLARPIQRTYILNSLEPVSNSIHPFINLRSKTDKASFYLHQELLPQDHPLYNMMTTTSFENKSG
jgi:hypothetical protein